MHTFYPYDSLLDNRATIFIKKVDQKTAIRENFNLRKSYILFIYLTSINDTVFVIYEGHNIKNMYPLHKISTPKYIN